LNAPKILDYGCGTGWFTAELATIGTVVGVDLSDRAITEARRRYPAATYVAANLFELDLPQREFEVVVSQEVIAHVVDPQEYIERISRMLKPEGYLVLTTANKLVMDRLEHPPDPEAHIKNWLGLRDLRRLLADRYRIVTHTSVIPRGDRGFLRVVNSAKVNAVFRVIAAQEQLDRIKERAGLGYALIVLAQLRTVAR
jgi:ubiquinone/menaquinone biosynthesis C-methylase UbiE